MIVRLTVSSSLRQQYISDTLECASGQEAYDLVIRFEQVGVLCLVPL